MIAFGERLKDERKALGWSQEEIAVKIGITKQTQGLYERSQRAPNAEYLAALAALGGDVLYVLTGQRTPAAQPLSVRESSMLDSYRALAEEDKTVIQRMAGALAQSVKSNGESA